MSKIPRVITSYEFAQALEAAGVVQGGDMIRRLVIDAQAGKAVVMHVERDADERLLNVVMSLRGIEVTTGQPATGKAGETENARP